MLRKAKEELVLKLHEELKNAECVIVTQPSGLNADENTELRSAAYQAGVKFRYVKNSLALRAAKETAFDGLFDDLSGSTAIGMSADPVAASKLLVNFSNDNEKLQVLKGAIESQIFDKSEVEKLSKVPPMDVLRGKIVGVLVAPHGKLARLMSAAQGDLVSLLSKKPEDKA